jgi:L,D-transpeptidase ErfK/SrfK
MGRSGMRRPACLSLLLLAVTGCPAGIAAPPADADDMARSYVVRAEDTLVDLARDNDIGYVEIIAANPGVDPWLPAPGTRVVLPSAHLLPAAPPQGIVINLPDQRLYFFAPGKPVQSFPIGVPTPDVEVQTGSSRVVAKREKPTWFPTASERIEMPELPASVPPGPDNPLGDYALYTAWTAIVIHGTNRPYGIGRRVSHGCFRLYPEDIATLYKQISIGTAVTVVDQPAKVAWANGTLYLEVHPTLDQADEIEATGKFAPEPVPGLDRLVLEAASPFPERIDWAAVDRVASARTGIPTPISRPTDPASVSDAH